MTTEADRPPKRILVTGASGAVGSAACTLLAARGHRVAGTMRSRGRRNAAVAGALEAAGVTVVEMDVTDGAGVHAGVDAALDALGGIDVLFNNAGVGSYGVQELFRAEEMQRVFDVNVFGVQRVMRSVLPHMRRRGSGTIVYTSSLIGRISVPYWATYCASKWALEAVAQSYRAELARFGIDSVIVEPGALPTPFLDGLVTPGDRSDDYAPELEALDHSLRGLVEMLESNSEQRPEMVAGVVAELVDTPHGMRPFRVIADRSGMGEPIVGYNEVLGEVTRAIYAANGMDADGMLSLNAGPT